MQLGRTLADPRATGFGLAIRTWVALLSDAYAEALEYSEQALAVALTPWDRNAAIIGKGCTLVMLRQTEEGANLPEEDRPRCLADGDLYQLAGTDGNRRVCKVLEETLPVESVGLKKQSQDATARAIGLRRVGIAYFYAKYFCKF